MGCSWEEVTYIRQKLWPWGWQCSLSSLQAHYDLYQPVSTIECYTFGQIPYESNHLGQA